jgi:signal transduction histidine kinase
MWFLGISIVVILVVIIGSTAFLVKLLRKSEMRQAKALHDMEYTNKMASIGRLAAGVAHEINNPLAIINEKAGLLKDFATLKPDFNYKEKVLKGVDSILNSVERCSVITHRLLGFAKRMDIITEVIDLELLLKDVIGFLERDASLHNIDININIDEDFPSIHSDRGQLQQVFLNILTNAYYAVKQGGKINIYATKLNEDELDISITDTGVGIAKENLEHIFEPFYTTKGKYGTGLGLSITYGIIQKLGGSIRVKSKLGEGTRFSVHLPIKPKHF